MTDQDGHARLQRHVDDRTGRNARQSGGVENARAKYGKIIADGMLDLHDQAMDQAKTYFSKGASPAHKPVIGYAGRISKAPGRVSTALDLATSKDPVRTAVGEASGQVGGRVGNVVGGVAGGIVALPAPPAGVVTAPAGIILGGVLGKGYAKAKALEAYDAYAPEITERAHEITDEVRRAADAVIARGRRFPTELTEAFTKGLAPPRSTAEPRPGQRYR